MKILILEDSPERHKAFLRWLIGHVVKITENAKDAIELLRAEDWDILFLDHDLGGEEMVVSGNGTGFEVAKWLAENPDNHPSKIVIHSYNPAGAMNMKSVLPTATLAPGCWITRCV